LTVSHAFITIEMLQFPNKGSRLTTAAVYYENILNCHAAMQFSSKFCQFSVILIIFLKETVLVNNGSLLSLEGNPQPEPNYNKAESKWILRRKCGSCEVVL
jgi:hypothetical protein